MGKKKALSVPANLSELKGSPRNPRKISDKALGGLAASMDRFGDISGIVWNTRLGELAAGHQRVDRLREAWGDLVIEPLDEEHGRIVAPSGQSWGVRFVDWPRARHDAAMVAANSGVIAGEYTDDLQELLAAVKGEDPGIYDDLLFGELALDVQPDNQVLPAAELQERRTCTVSWPVDEDHVMLAFLAIADGAGLPENLGSAIFERIRATVAAGKDRQPRRKKTA